MCWKLREICNIVPFYLMREYLIEGLNIVPRLDLDRLESGFLPPEDISLISQNDEVPESEDVLIDRLKNNCRCLGLKDNGRLVAYTWCNLLEIDYEGLKNHIKLKEDEAYLFDARTFKSHRGKNLAPFLRYRLYKHLTKIGRIKFISASSVLNSSAIKFKEKLGAKKYILYLYISLFSKFQWNIILKNYEIDNLFYVHRIN